MTSAKHGDTHSLTERGGDHYESVRSQQAASPPNIDSNFASGPVRALIPLRRQFSAPIRSADRLRTEDGIAIPTLQPAAAFRSDPFAAFRPSCLSR